jgi:glycosyltransferase involved in cell wall biosynthesis
MLPGLGERGGVANRSALLVTGLTLRGWDVRGVARAGTATRLHVARGDGYLVFEVPGFKWGRVGAVPYLAAAVPLGLFWARRAEVVLAIQPSSQATAGAIAATLWRRPLLISLTISGQLSEMSLFEGRFQGAIRRRLLGRAIFLAQTDFAAKEVAATLPGVRVMVLPNPVECMADPPQLRGTLRAMYAGRFSSQKRLDVLLDAWRSVTEHEPSARLSLVGEGGSYGSVEHELEARVRADERLAATVEISGWASDMQPWWASHDVFVLASDSEGMSNSLLEACAQGRVVVASAIPQNVAVLGPDYPLLFTPGDAAKLAEALIAALTDGPLRELARKSVLSVAQEHSLDRVLDQLEDIIDAVANRSRHQF